MIKFFDLQKRITTIDNCQLISLNTILRDEGKLTIIEEIKDVPFKIRRVYYIHRVPNDSARGFHAHKSLNQLMIAISGSFMVWLTDGQRGRFIKLNSPTKGLFISNGIWRELNDFSSDAVCLVLASKRYDEKDYIRSYDDFLKFKHEESISNNS